MNVRLLIAALLCVHSLISQITVNVSLPPAMEINRSAVFTVTLTKGPVKNFSKYLLEVPPGVVISEVETRSGSFFFDNNQARVVWPITPVAETFTFKLELNSGATPGMKELKQTYYFMESDTKKSVALSPVELAVTDSVNGVYAGSISMVKKNPGPVVGEETSEELEQRVKQLRKDAAEASEAGNREKLAAEMKLSEAAQELEAAMKLKDEEKRNKLTEAARVKKEEATLSIETAEKIIVLSQKLNANADEIERLSNSKTEADEGLVKETPGGFSVPAVNRQKARDSLDATNPTIKTGYVKTEHPEELKKQVEQLRKDSREATQSGDKAKKAALIKLNEAEAAYREAENIKREKVRKDAMALAGKEKAEAENDLLVADRILTLAASLSANADELEKKYFEALNPPVITDSVVKENKSEKDLDKLTEAFKDVNKPITPGPESKLKVRTDRENGFFVQIGAFGKQPDKKEFKDLGEIVVRHENGFYKVLAGAFSDRDAANQKKNSLKAKGYDGFVIEYRDGERVK